ncbi:MAG: chemotaxis protein CheW [Polyangiaceae bacterium]|nr:chemotaxis protein CheW [Polyangiaceae bacterium]
MTKREEIVAAIERLQNELSELRRQLASSFAAERLPEAEFMMLRCRCGQSEVAFLLDSVIEVVMMPALTALPEGSPWVAGVLNLRGRAIPVLDVAARLSRATSRVCASDYVVVCTAEQGSVGLVVQELGEPTAIAREQVHASGDGLSVAPYFLGFVQRGEVQVALLDVGALVNVSSVPELAA